MSATHLSSKNQRNSLAMAGAHFDTLSLPAHTTSRQLRVSVCVDSNNLADRFGLLLLQLDGWMEIRSVGSGRLISEITSHVSIRSLGRHCRFFLFVFVFYIALI